MTWVLACCRGADLDRVDAEQRFDLFVWVLDDDPGPGCPLAALRGTARRGPAGMRGWGWRSRSARPLCQERRGVRCGGGRRRAHTRDCRRRSPGVVGSCARGRVRGGDGVGPERVLGRVERARDPGAVPRVRVRPASQRWTVFTSTWTMSANSSRVSPERVIAARRCSLSNAPPTRNGGFAAG